MQLSKSFRLSEFFVSRTAASLGILNTTDDLNVIQNLRALAMRVLQPLRDALGIPILISSGWRSLSLNKAVGGASTSQHLKGQASDIFVPGFTPIEVARKIVSLGLDYDQLIVYPTFVHVSHNVSGNRKQFLYHKTYKGSKL